MWAIFKREIKSFFLSPIAYVYLCIFLFISSFFFTMSIIPQSPTLIPVVNYADTLNTITFTLIFVIPILTMRLLSEERKNGTDLLLLTSPVSITGIVAGKYFAAIFEFLVGLIITLIYPIILAFFSKVDASIIFTGYVGCFLVGAVFIAIGLFVSSFCKNQITAAIISFCFLLIVWVLEAAKALLNLSESGQGIVDSFLVLKKYNEFSSGLFDIGALIFFVSLIILFLFFTLRMIEKRRWSEE
ncbi:MAG: ABC transporter permease [Deltaproteobacteria bacterium]